MEPIATTVRRFIAASFSVGDLDALAGDMSLRDRGIVDSNGVIDLAAFLEGEYGITIFDAEIVPANLDSIDRVVAFVERKRTVMAA